MDRTEQLAVFKHLVDINTVADHETQVAEYLHGLFKQHGISSQVIEQLPGRSNLIAEIGDGNGPTLAFSGHEDTVHQGNESNWQTPPFQATIADGKLYGRGATDMKGGLAAQVIALIQLHESKQPIHGRIRFLATISEELTQGGAHFLSQRGAVDDVDAVVLGEPTGVPAGDANAFFQSGGTNTDAQVVTSLANAGENVDQHFIVNAHKGALIYTVESHGKAAHSSTPNLGISAIDNLFDYRVAERQLFESFQQRNSELGATIYTPDIFKGGEQVNSIPDYAYQKVMVRTIPELPNDQIIAELKALIAQFNQKAGYQLELTVTFSGNPVQSNPNAPIIQAAHQVAPAILAEPLNLPLMQMSMGTDGSQFKARNPKLELIVLGPGNNTAHQANEFVDLNSYYGFIELYQALAVQYLNQ